MTQHINLLQHKHRPIGAALAALAVLLASLLCLLVYGAVLARQTNALRQQLSTSALDLQASKTALLAMGARAGASADTANVHAEIDQIKSKLAIAKKWGALLSDNSLGSPAGYLTHFNTLGSVSEDGLWLTSIFVSDKGKLVNLTGRALQSGSVLRYAEKLNLAFARQGVQFNSVEMTPEDLVRTGQDGRPALRSVNFRLF